MEVLTLKNSLCEECFNFNCSWHLNFVPVKGWSAKPTILKDHQKTMSSYRVERCPEFKARDGGYIRISTQNLAQLLDMSHRTLMRELAVNGNTLSNKLWKKGYMLMSHRDCGDKYNKYYIAELNVL